MLPHQGVAGVRRYVSGTLMASSGCPDSIFAICLTAADMFVFTFVVVACLKNKYIYKILFEFWDGMGRRDDQN
mgnify:CR=1 FL=1